MELSPRGNEIRKIVGDGYAVQARGAEMESLGTQMLESASILKLIGSGAEGKGYSMEEIRKNVGDLHIDLHRAGERYEPSGRVLREYGEALVSVQHNLNSIVDECVELWAAYESSSSAHSSASGKRVPSDETPEQASARWADLADLRSARTNAYEAWQSEAERFDAPFDTWDSAYEMALGGLKDANDRGVSDTFWDNGLPFVEAILIVLAVAGVVLAVLAIIVGTPFIAMAAAIVGIVALGLTIWKVAAGRGDKSDIGWAVVGVIPFGRLSQLGTAFKSMNGAGSFVKGFGADFIGLTPRLEIRSVDGLSALVRSTPVVNAAGRATDPDIVARMWRFGDTLGDLPYATPGGWNNMASRLLGGSSGQLADSFVAQFAQRSVNYTNRMDDILVSSGMWLDGMQHARSGLQTGLTVVDTLAKPAQGAWVLGGELVDLLDGKSEADAWSAELMRNK